MFSFKFLIVSITFKQDHLLTIKFTKGHDWLVLCQQHNKQISIYF